MFIKHGATRANVLNPAEKIGSIMLLILLRNITLYSYIILYLIIYYYVTYESITLHNPTIPSLGHEKKKRLFTVGYFEPT